MSKKSVNEMIKKKILDGITWKHTGKMEGMASYSTCCHDNPFCNARRKHKINVCVNCYAYRQLSFYRDLKAKVQKNQEFITTWDLKSEHVPYIDKTMFRFEAFGELLNMQQVKNYFTIARNNKHCRFVLWSKQPDIIQEAIKHYHIGKPGNMTIIYSSPQKNIPALDTMKKYRFIDKLFTVYEKESAGSVDINCGSKKCSECRLCYSDNNVKFINELLK